MNTSETGGNPPFSRNIHKFQDALRAASPMKLTGKVTQIIGLVIESQALLCELSLCRDAARAGGGRRIS